MNPLFSVKNLRIEREAVILREVNWQVERGQHWVMLGANGSGKTSLLSALTGYLTPTRGEMQIGDAVFGASDWRAVRTAVGLVSASLGHRIEPEQYAKEIVASGHDAQINFWGRIKPELARRASRILRDIKASHLAERPWTYLSQGERQRILIGRALMADLKILFLDEPCAGLDPVAREDFLGFLRKLARRRNGPALVLVTHHVEEILPEFSHVLLLAGGKVQAAGAQKDILTSANLSKTFAARVRLQKHGGRYRLAIGHARTSFAL